MEEPSIFTRGALIELLARTTIAAVFTYFMGKKLMKLIDPTIEKSNTMRDKAKKLFKTLDIKDPGQLTEHEMQIAAQLVMPSELHTSFKDIAGLSHIIEELNESITLPLLQRKKGHTSKLLQPPKGVLLYGPPGCGKTILAKAIASECGFRFINLDISTLTDKYFGESQKYCTALFTMAQKLEPCIVFVDEIDSFLRSRSTLDGETTAMMKSLFLQHWDGITTDNSKCVIVMGATNRPHDVDKAFWRRMPARFHIPLPNMEQRREILQLVLENEEYEESINLGDIAEVTRGFSGSDLREVCRSASIQRLRTCKQRSKSSCTVDQQSIGPISLENMVTAVQKFLSKSDFQDNTDTAYD